VLYADALMKYQGFALYTEYATRSSDNPITYKDSTRKDYAAVFVGTGFMAQASYVFPSMWNVSARYALVDAGDQLIGLAEYQRQVNISCVVGYYINLHRIKANLELGTNRLSVRNSSDNLRHSLYARFNLELGI
jgi:predicted dinucleotide-utilizing enzyme